MVTRRRDVEIAMRRVPVAGLRERASLRIHRSLPARLQPAGEPCIIAEMKKASPSAGRLAGEYRPAEIARAYAAAGACALSVLTEPHHFAGELRHLRRAREACDLPVLRKDFICSEYQVVESAAWGADVILLIVAALPPAELHFLHQAAVDLGLDVLVEAHTAEELEAALALDPAIIGVNSRDLNTLKTSLNVARRLAAAIPPGRMAIAESGIKSREEVVELASLGYRGFLVGESLMRSPDCGATLRGLRGA